MVTKVNNHKWTWDPYNQEKSK